jgi:hypothetical protein
MSTMFRRQIERLRTMSATTRERYVTTAARVLGLAIGLGIGVMLKLLGAY